jgi:FixJ family two-component response regulator
VRTRAFAAVTSQSGQQFPAALPEPLPDCLILGLPMQAVAGLEMQQDVAPKGTRISTIVIHGTR